MKVTICGGGIMGASTAFHLAQKGVKCTVVERAGLASSASGKAGGFMEKDWCDGSEMGPMARKGFEMHMTLANDPRFKDCDYRCVDSLGVRVREGADGNTKDLPSWMDGSILGTSNLGNTSTTAQVHPYKLTNAFFQAAKDLVGSELYEGVVQGIQMSGSKVTGVKTNRGVIPTDVVVIAMGPWSGGALKWLNMRPVVDGYRFHSIVLEPTKQTSAHCCFVQYTGTSGQRESPMIYPRPDGTVYMCGIGDGPKLPDDPKQVKCDQAPCKQLKRIGGCVSSAIRDGKVVTQQACFLPSSSDGLPLVGPVPGVEGVFLAAGHSCYGIVSSSVTGEAIAQLIVDGKCSVINLKPFDPARLLK